MFHKKTVVVFVYLQIIIIHYNTFINHRAKHVFFYFVLFEDLASDCEELRVRGYRKSGDYNITLNHDAKFMVGIYGLP